MNKGRRRKGICPQMTQMDADGEFVFFISALIRVICGQFRNRLRLAALGSLRLNPQSALSSVASAEEEIRPPSPRLRQAGNPPCPP
jgi:hypothetical protein